VAIILEPDSLPNLITNGGDPQCGRATHTAYTRGVEYAARRLSEAVPSVSIYLDAGHGGWIGWDEKAQAYMQLVCSLGERRPLEFDARRHQRHSSI
jgi:cellulose 1,4-beta-cellobiosidase